MLKQDVNDQHNSIMLEVAMTIETKPALTC